ncbi:MAG: hypothetical protein HZB99_00915, partial [Candidatus Harrisonbacteria bacterium]|nr:hypothetical protein [Candidatus Harrisonbacteria bacterium]
YINGILNVPITSLSTFGQASSTMLSVYNTLYVGGTATTTIAGDNSTSTFAGGITLTSGNFNLPTGGVYLINNSPVLTSTTLGSTVVNSSLTSVGALSAGSITSGFGTITAGTTTVNNLVVTNTSTSTFAGDLSANALNITSTSATSTFANGLRLTGGTLQINSLLSCDTIDTDASGNLRCGTDATGAGGGIATVQENDVTAVSSATVLDFLGADFAVTDAGSGEADVAIDYANSGITRSGQNETISGLWRFNQASSTRFSVTDTLYIGGTATTTLSGNSATSTFSGGLSLSAGNVNLATGGVYLINNVGILNSTTLGSGVVNSSLTSVGALSSGSIVSGFGSVNIGANSLTAGAGSLSSLVTTGNVGVGTSTPSGALGVQGNALISGNLTAANLTATGTLSLSGTTGTTTIASGQGFTIGGSQLVVIGSTGNIGIGTTSPVRTLTINGNIGGNTVVDSQSLTTSSTVTESTKASSYFLANNSGTTDASVTTTFNVTGLPDLDGTFAFIELKAQKGVTTNARTQTVILQINGTQVTDVSTASTTAASTLNKNFTAVRMNSSWRIIGATGNGSGGIGGGAVVKVKAADESVTSSAVLQNDDELSFPIGANETWSAFFSIEATSAASQPDIQFAVAAPSGATCDISFSLLNSPSSGAGADLGCGVAATGIAIGAAQKVILFITVSVQNGSTAGFVNFQWAQDISNGTATTVQLGSYLYAFKSIGADVAEAYYTKDKTIVSGDLVAIDSSMRAGVQKTSGKYDRNTLGVITTMPGLALGDSKKPEGSRTVFVAITGRVPVKVSTENGPIVPGDFITSSSIPGVGMKATGSGMVIGQALAGYDGSEVGTVLMFIKNFYSFGNDLGNVDLASGEVIKSWLESMKVFVEDGLVRLKELVAEKITAKKIVAEKATLKRFELEDEVTGETYCIKMRNGALVSEVGSCADPVSDDSESPEVVSEPAPENSDTSSSTADEPSPEESTSVEVSSDDSAPVSSETAVGEPSSDSPEAAPEAESSVESVPAE